MGTGSVAGITQRECPGHSCRPGRRCIVTGNTNGGERMDRYMSKGTLGQVVKRAISDAGFRRQLQSDPEGALKGFDLTSDERAALRSGDASKLSSLGIDQRMSKAFAMGEAAAAVSRHGAGSDLAMGATIPDGGEPLVSDALISGGGGRANDALIGEASGAKGARISDAGGSVRTTITDADRLASVNAAFEGGDAAPGRSALDNSATASREGTAYITADESGNNVVPGGSAGGQASLDVSGQVRGSAAITADEAGRDVAARGTQDYGQQTSLDVSGNTRDTSAISGDAAGRQGDAFITADEMGNDATAAVRAPDADTAITQREALDDAAMANPEGYDQPDPNA